MKGGKEKSDCDAMDNQENIRWETDARGRRFHVLGESGLAEYEDGDIVNVIEIDNGSPFLDDDMWDDPEDYLPGGSPDRLPDGSSDDLPGGSAVNWGQHGADHLTPDNPDYWYFYYDPRYCGPSVEDYVRRQVEVYRRDKGRPWPGSVLPGELNPDYVAEEQASIDRRIDELHRRPSYPSADGASGGASGSSASGGHAPSVSTSGTAGRRKWKRSRRERWEDLALTLFTITAFVGLVLLVRAGYAELAGRLVFVPIGTLAARVGRMIADYKARHRRQ